MSLIFVMSILMAVIATASSLFPQSSAFVIFLLFFLYGISSVSIPGPVQFTSHLCRLVGCVFVFSHPILFSPLKRLDHTWPLQVMGARAVPVPFPGSALLWGVAQVPTITMTNTFSC